MSECVIYDFETLSQDQRRGVVISFAILNFSESRYINNPYTYEELLDSTKYIKFDVEDQVQNYKRLISKDTLQWWTEQGPEAKKQLKPSDSDVSIYTLHDWILANVDCKNIKKSFTRGNTFDPIILQYIMTQTGKVDPFHWGTVRDTRSMIEGMSFGMDLKNSFMPNDLKDKFVKHNPIHDIAMDVMRMQMLAQAILQ